MDVVRQSFSVEYVRVEVTLVHENTMYSVTKSTLEKCKITAYMLLHFSIQEKIQKGGTEK